MAIYGMTTSDEWWEDKAKSAAAESSRIGKEAALEETKTAEGYSPNTRLGMPGDIRGRDIFGNPRGATPSYMGEERTVGTPIKKEPF